MSRTAFTPTRRRLAELRLAAQGVGAGVGADVGPGGAAGDPATPGDVVRRMLALQGQDLPGVKWSVGLRRAGLTEAAVEAAFDAGDIVRSWPLRGTLHLVAGEDLRWLLGLTAPRAIAAAARRRAALEITEADVERAREIATVVLAGRRTLKRDALLAAFAAGGVGTRGQRGYHLLGYLALAGTLVLGPTDGRQQAFALLDDWVPNPRRLERDQALGELAFRYFRSHGPATVADLAWWSGMALADVRRGLAVCGSLLTTLQLDGLTFHVTSEALSPSPAAPASRVQLLPGFDEYLLGYQDRSAALARERRDAIAPGGNGVFRPTIVVDGEVVGTWGRSGTSRQVVIDPVPFGRLAVGVRDAMAKAAGAYGAYLGRPVRLAEIGAT